MPLFSSKQFSLVIGPFFRSSILIFSSKPLFIQEYNVPGYMKSLERSVTLDHLPDFVQIL